MRVHRILRYGAVYGDPLPDGVLDDDGAARGVYFMFLSARPHALEFLKGEWIDNGGFVGLGAENDPIAGDNAGHGTYTIPAQPVRRRLHGLERFTVTKGGEYAFLPSLSALRWLAVEPALTIRPSSPTTRPGGPGRRLRRAPGGGGAGGGVAAGAGRPAE